MFLLKWKHHRRPTWTPKSKLKCHQLLVDFEATNGPTILGNSICISFLLDSITIDSFARFYHIGYECESLWIFWKLFRRCKARFCEWNTIFDANERRIIPENHEISWRKAWIILCADHSIFTKQNPMARWCITKPWNDFSGGSQATKKGAV